MPEKVLLFLSLWFLDFFLVIEKKSLHILYFFLHSFSFLLSVLFPFSPFAALVDLLWHGLLSLLFQSFSLKISRCDLFSLFPCPSLSFIPWDFSYTLLSEYFLLVYPASEAQTFCFSYSNTSSFLLSPKWESCATNFNLEIVLLQKQYKKKKKKEERNQQERRGPEKRYPELTDRQTQIFSVGSRERDRER